VYYICPMIRFFAFLALCVVFASCDLTEGEKVKASVNAQVLGEDLIFMELETFQWVVTLKDYVQNYHQTGNATNRYLSACPTITLDSSSYSYITKKPGTQEWYSNLHVNLAFNGNCRDQDDVVREGNVTMSMRKGGVENDTLGYVHFDSLFVDPYYITGSMEVVEKLPFVTANFDYPEFKVKGENLQIEAGNFKYFIDLNLVIRQNKGNGTLEFTDDIFSYYGYVLGTDRKGDEFTLTIPEKLIWEGTTNCRKAFKHGVSKVEFSEGTFFIDYDLADKFFCDNFGSLILDPDKAPVEVPLRR
jgi:hypothetical protein